MTLTNRLPRGASRALLRAPIALYRAGLGWVFGRRLLYLVHVGRKSGRHRQTVLEVVSYDPDRPEAVVVSGWGKRSDWYRNICAAPALEVRVGRHRWIAPRQRMLEADETIAVLIAYRQRHPRAWRRIAPMLGFPLDPASPEARAQVSELPAFAFAPHSAS